MRAYTNDAPPLALAGQERLSAALRELREFEVELDGTAYRSGTVRGTNSHQLRFEEQRLALAKLRGTLEFFAAQRAREQLLGPEAGASSGQANDRRTPSQILDQVRARPP